MEMFSLKAEVTAFKGHVPIRGKTVIVMYWNK
jgi:hypothetical protein